MDVLKVANNFQFTKNQSCTFFISIDFTFPPPWWPTFLNFPLFLFFHSFLRFLFCFVYLIRTSHHPHWTYRYKWSHKSSLTHRTHVSSSLRKRAMMKDFIIISYSSYMEVWKYVKFVPNFFLGFELKTKDSRSFLSEWLMQKVSEIVVVVVVKCIVRVFRRHLCWGDGCWISKIIIIELDIFSICWCCSPQSIVQSFTFKFIIEVGELLKEAFIWMNIAMHSNCSDCFCCRHFSRYHQISENTSCWTWHSNHTMNKNFS